MITGGCLCGAVRYEATGTPLTTRVCWCRLCQKLGAGSGTVNVAFLSENIRISGTLTEYASTADSGNTLIRGFCAICGTPITSQAETRKHQMFVRAGTLDDPEIAQPEVTIWTSQAPSWACISSALPMIDEQPAPAK